MSRIPAHLLLKQMKQSITPSYLESLHIEAPTPDVREAWINGSWDISPEPYSEDDEDTTTVTLPGIQL